MVSRNQERLHTTQREMEWWSDLTALFYSYFAVTQNSRKNGNVTCQYYLPTVQQYTLQWGYLLMFGCPPVQNPFILELHVIQCHTRVSWGLSWHSYRFYRNTTYTSCPQTKSAYDQHTQQQAFKINQSVWLSLPTADKFDAMWEGGWKIKTVKGPTTYIITHERRTKTVHVNQFHMHNKLTSDSTAIPEEGTWEVPSIEHEVIDTEIPRE